KNSWGTGWGESGYFRISYSENVLNFDVWYNDPYDARTFFLDDSYYVTGTDIGTIPTVNSAQANITYANSTTPINFTVYAKGNSIKQLLSVKINGTSMSGTLLTGGTFSTIKTLSDFGCQSFEGNCVLTINATDDAGKANTSEKITVVVDDLAPRVTANPTVYPDNQNAARNGSLITLNATIIDFGDGVINATVNASQVNGSLGNIILNNISGFWTNSSVLLNTSDGIYYLNITAYDNVSNLNNTVQITVIVDNTPPNVSVYPVSYQRGSAANTHSIIGFSASADDPLINSTSAGLKNASVNASLINNTGRIELTNQSGIWRGNATFDIFQPDGYYLLNVTFFDNAGNINNSVQINVSIDNTPPSVADVCVSSQFINVTGFTNISANITSLDTVSQVNQSEVFARVTYPNGTSINHPMNASGGSLFYYNFTDTAQYGRFNATILANDTTGNINSTQRTQFATAFITNNESVVTRANNSTVVNAPLSNTTLYLFTNNTSVGAINITQSKINMTSNELSITNPGIYVNVNVSSSIRNNLSYVIICVNYSDAEVSSYVESTLRLYRWNTSSLSWDWLAGTGSYPYVNNAGVDTTNNFVWANLTELSEFAVSGELYVPPPPQKTSSSGGGSSGGGSSGEDYYNIVLSETDRQSVFKNSDVSYRFDLEDNIVRHINFTALNSAGTVAAKVEVLNHTSTLVSTPPPHEVYKNLNIWVGNYGWATEKNMADTTVSFMVRKSWVTDNDISETSIALNRYSDDKWDRLVTSKTGGDSDYLYFEAEVTGFSPFAITGKKTVRELGGIGTIAEPTLTAEKTPVSTPTEKKGIPGFGLFVGLSVLLIAVQLLHKKN
ncbi:MAG: PGF-pre-PGF domain-containing protein, partial [ANME-2 cluster archaeon]|nr:PGF-pre-PGF domain-containing protein [ANME-2 cluster archaeon]